MPLPSDSDPIDANVIKYLQDLIDSTGSNNPDKVRAIAFFFDEQKPKVFRRPGLPTPEDKGHSDPAIPDTVTARLKRRDSVEAIVYQQNPTCVWIFVNGSHKVYCG